MTDLEQPLVLLTGATGYVGGRLLPVLERAGVRVRCLARRPDYLAGRVGATTEVVRGDCLDADSLAPAFAGVHTAYYLVHSLGTRGSFEERTCAQRDTFAHAARAAGVSRIVYLGGLGDAGEGLSAHLRSRQRDGHGARAPPACRSSSSTRRSSWARAACRTSCCAPSSSACR